MCFSELFGHDRLNPKGHCPSSVAGISCAEEAGRKSVGLLFVFDLGGLQFQGHLSTAIQDAEMCSVPS